MKNFKNFFTFYFLLFTSPTKSEQGQSMVEYLVIVFLISLAFFTTVNKFGTVMNASFATAIDKIAFNIK